MTVTLPSSPIQRHESLYFETLTFLVEDQLFRIPRLYIERTSSVFSDMFQLSCGSELEGSSDQNPIYLPPDIKRIDFERLLWAMFPDLNRFSKVQMTMGQDEWMSVLKLSTLWYMGELRQEAIDGISLLTIDPIVKVILAREYRVGKWLAEAYVDLVKRESVPTLEETRMLGWETAYSIMKAREDTHKPSQAAQTHYCNHCGVYAEIPAIRRKVDHLDTGILDAFQEELKDVNCDGDAYTAVGLEVVPDMKEKRAVRQAIAAKRKREQSL